MIDQFFDLSATFLHASIEFALACAIVVFALIAINVAVCRVNNSVIHYRQKLKEIEFLKSEVRRLKAQIFKMGFTEQAEGKE